MAPMPAVESALPPGSVGGQAAELPGGYREDLPREARYLRWTVEAALHDAGRVDGDASRTVAVLGTTLHGIRAGGRFLRTGELEELRSFLAGATAKLALSGLGIEGGVLTTCSACSSSLGAVALGVTLLERGAADVVVAGGYDAMSEYSWAGFNSLRLIADGPLRPFCKGRTGMKVAEGYGIVVLERASDAARRGGRVRACVAGWGESADAHHLTQPHPQGEGALAAMRSALGLAGVGASELGMVAAHATGTPDNDGAEYQALSRLLGDGLSRVPVVGFKSFLGHTLGGAGAVELVMSSMALRDQRVPGCPNVRGEDVEFAGLTVANGAAAERDIGATLNTSLGFGGANTCVVMTKNAERSQPVREPAEAWITGVGVVLPGAVGLAAFAARLAGSGAAPTGIDDAALGEYMNVRRARRLSQYVKYTIAAASMAVRDAGLADRPELVAQSAALLGSMHGSACFCYDYYSQIVKEGALAANPVLFAEGVPNAAAAHLSTTLGVKGACQTIIGTRTAGLDALALAALRVKSGAVERVIVVAAEEACEVVDRAYRACGRLKADEAGSFGGVAFVVESAQAARARGAAAYAEVTGNAWASADAKGGIGRAASAADGRFGEGFSVTPLAQIAAELAGGDGEPFTSACADWTGATSAVSLRRMDRRMGS
jgi:3-oxoacyl-[acyl-carrier-protein] synthase II